MKYRKNGRTYRRMLWFPFFALRCNSCALTNEAQATGTKSCPRNDSGLMCTNGDGINRVWRETLFSKIRNWRRKG
jgi:hypothetical protein